MTVFEKLSKLKVGALFMEMGTGKTKIALDLIAHKKNKIDYILWICPFSVKQEIENERLKWHSELNIEIVGCESIGSSDKIFLELFNKIKSHKTFIVVDESLKIKNRTAKRTQRILLFGEHAQYKLILNGTPLSKNVLDLWTQMQFLSPKILNMSFNQFKNTYCEYYLNGKLKNKVKCQHNIEHLISLIEPYIFDSELDLGKKKCYHTLTYEIDDKDYYEKIKFDYLDNEDINFYRLATLLQKQYCNSIDKIEVLNNLLNKIDSQVIIFVKFVSSIPENVQFINGDKSIKEREKTLRAFKNGNFKVLYITYGCGSFGLNLQFCKNIIFLEHTFDYSQRIQAEARIYRLGQENDVNYYDICCNCGLERMIMNCLSKKKNLLDEIKTEIDKKGVNEWLKNI